LKKTEGRLNRLFELPKEIQNGNTKVIINSFEEMLIENYKGVLEYEEFYMKIKTELGIININGFNLGVEQITEDDIIVKRENRKFRYRTSSGGIEQVIIKIVLNYILGYVNIKVESFFVERFVNMCISKRILLWNIKRKKSTILYANIGIKDYKRLKGVARKTQSKINIESKKGLPFFMHKYRKRKIYIVLLGIIVSGIITLSNFVWNIQIIGNENISNKEILESLEQEGLKIGILKNKVNIYSIINRVRLNRSDIAWMGINIKGTNAIVNIQESIKAPEVINESEYCNIVANKTGLITKINVQNGTAMVSEGDIVKEGDVLVSGYIEGKYTGIRYVHASAEIEARVWYSKKEKQLLNQTIKTETGATEKKYSLNFNNFKINLYKTLSKFKNYDTISEEKKLVLFSNFYLPIKIEKITNYEYEFQDIMYTEEELKQKLEKKLKEELQDEIQDKDNIVNIQTNTYNEEGYIEVEVIYEVLENIGNKDKIIF